MAIEIDDVCYFYGDFSSGFAVRMVQLGTDGTLKSTTTLDHHALAGAEYDVAYIVSCTSYGTTLYLILRAQSFSTDSILYVLVTVAPDLSATASVLSTYKLNFAGPTTYTDASNAFGLSGVVVGVSIVALFDGSLVVVMADAEENIQYIVHIGGDAFSLSGNLYTYLLAGYDSQQVVMLAVGEATDTVSLLNLTNENAGVLYGASAFLTIGAAVIKTNHEIAIGIFRSRYLGEEFGDGVLSIVRHNGQGPENVVYSFSVAPDEIPTIGGVIGVSDDGAHLYALTIIDGSPLRTFTVLRGPIEGPFTSIYELQQANADATAFWTATGPVVAMIPAGPVSDVAAAGRFCAVL